MKTKIYFVLSIFFAIISIILDFLYKVDLSKVYLSKVDFATLMNKLLDYQLVILSVMVAVYFVVVQLYKNRFPKFTTNSKINSDFIYQFKYLIFLIIFGFVMSGLKIQLFFSVFLYFVYFAIGLKNYIRTLQLYISFDPIEIITKSQINIIDELGKQESNIGENINILKRYAEESFEKNDIELNKFVLREYSNIFNELIINKDKSILLNADSVKYEEIEEKIFSLNRFLLNRCLIFNNEIIFSKLIGLLHESLLKTIRCNKTDMFREICNQIDRTFKSVVMRENDTFALIILSTYSEIYEYILNNENQVDKVWKEELYHVFQRYGLISDIHVRENEKIMKILIQEYFSIARLSISKDNLNDNGIAEDILGIIYRLIPNISKSAYKFIEVSFISWCIAEKNNDTKLKFIIQEICKLGSIGVDYKNLELIYIFRNILKYLEFEYKDEDLLEKINDILMEFSLVVSVVDTKMIKVFIPDLKNNFLNRLKKIEECKEIALYIKRLLLKTLVSDDTNLVNYMLEELNKIILMYRKDEKDKQEIFLDVYVEIFEKSISMSKMDSFNILLYSHSELIKELDKESKISDKLAIKILEDLGSLAKTNNKTNESEISPIIMTTLSNLIEEINLFKEVKFTKLIISMISEIGILGIEYTNKETIMACSNTLGWLAKKLIEREQPQSFKEVIVRVEILYKIAIEYQIEHNVILFIGTLFIILGSYLIKENKHSYYSELLSISRRLPNKENLKSSKNIRESQVRGWEDTLGPNAKQNMEKFVNEIFKK